MEEEEIVGNAKIIGEKHLGPGLHELAKKHPIIGEVRGMGVFWALDLVGDPQTKSPLSADHMARLKGFLIDHGLLGFLAENRLHVVPPCVVTPEQVAEGLGIIDRVLTELTR